MQTLHSDSRSRLPDGGGGKRQGKEDTKRLKKSSVDLDIFTMCRNGFTDIYMSKVISCKL